MAKLPSVTSSIPRDLQQFILRVKEALEGTGPDAMVSARQLIAAGIAEGVGNGGITAPVSDVVDPPRAPTGVSAAGALATIIVSWNSPAYRGHAYSEIWAASRTQAQTDATPPENPIIGQAELVGMTAGNNFSHNLGSGAQRWYWVRFVNRSGVAGPYNLTAGTFGETSQDPAYLLSVLTDAVTSTQLASALSTRIDLVDADASVAGSVNQRVQTVATVAGQNTAAIQVNADSVDGLEAQYTVKIDNNGHVSGFGLASTTVDGARVSDFMVAADRFSVVNPTVAGGAITACFDASNSSQRYIIIPNAMWDSYTHASGDKLTIKGMGSRNNTYGIVSKGNYLNPSIGKALLVSERSDEVPYTYLPDLPSANGQSYSERMAATYPEATGTINLSKEVPFVISTGSTQINGVTVPAGTYIDSAMIADATITNAQIGSLTADKITASLLNTVDFYGNTIAGSTIYLGGTITYNTDSGGNNIGIASVATPKVAMTSTGAAFAVDAFTINNPGGTDVTPFSITSDVVSIDSALIKDGTITNAKIGNTIQSSSYSAGSAGWKIDKSGAAELNNATFRGTLDITGSSGSNRLEITGDTIKVIDSSNVVRVKIGDLS
ncbi:DUF1983 domain-containing protein [Akkermansiaceae bacterium]|nr:DUF1983 domain-containing protein [Akkermansiaceae bacterium]